MDSQPNNGKIIRNFRNILVSLNFDLLLIARYMDEGDNSYDYNDFEYLVMTLEDRRYMRHCGIDIRSFVREALKAIRFKKHGGASTIDMQMVRTITGFKEHTLFRKIYESILAYLINHKFNKKQIIRCYLRHAFFGSGLYGHENASLSIYNKMTHELTFEEKSFIAAMLLKPKPLNPSQTWFNSVNNRASYAQRMRPFVKERNK
ncbi:biosynthetic peptidoglycan transglycosylase [Pectobacterium sp. 1950-15]|uniref:biosynthetic peptidoglycan transglycosylase n=1 Tax=Pectobacterium sp. 1950-15 TaxID=3128982 RepID=UPI0030170F15